MNFIFLIGQTPVLLEKWEQNLEEIDQDNGFVSLILH